MLKNLLLLLLTIGITSACFAQKKRWTTANGNAVRKAQATSFYTKTKVKGTPSFLIKRYYLDHSTPFEEVTYLSKKLVTKQGLFSTYHTNGKLKVQGEYFNNLKTGTWKIYDENKQLITSSQYKNDVLNGDYTNYLKDGIIEKGIYKEGKRENVWSYTEKDGTLTKSINYVNGQKHGDAFTFYSNGNIKERKSYDADLLYETKNFDEEGKEVLIIEDLTVYTIVEDAPEFTGGMQAMMRFLANNTRYPQEAIDNDIQGRAFISFTVEKDGSITEVESALSPDKEVHHLLLKEGIRVVKSMPNWKPGKQRGKNVRVRYTIPINFRIN